jgi:acetolactate synthase-like protein
MSLFKSLCKYTATIRYVRDIPEILRKAIQVAQSDTPGPVFVEFPIDTLYPYHLVQKELGIKSDSKSFVQKLIGLYLNNYLYSLFAGAFDKHDFSPLKTSHPVATPTEG